MKSNRIGRFKASVLLGLALVAGFNAAPSMASNQLATMVGNTSSGAISTGGEIMATDFGDIIYFIVALGLIGLVVGVILLYVRRKS